MVYRTYIENIQIFGNDEYYPEWIDFIKSKAIEVDEDGLYEGEIEDIQGMFEVIDKITRRLINERHERVEKGKKDFKGNPLRELTDLSDSIWLDEDTPILMFNKQIVENAYCFLPYQVYLAVEDKIKLTNDYSINGINWAFCSYKIKDGEKIEVRAS